MEKELQAAKDHAEEANESLMNDSIGKAKEHSKHLHASGEFNVNDRVQQIPDILFSASERAHHLCKMEKELEAAQDCAEEGKESFVNHSIGNAKKHSKLSVPENLTQKRTKPRTQKNTKNTILS